MSFESLNINNCYRTANDDIIQDFLTPALKEAILYKRAAGFFSSTALVELSRGISGLIKNNGKMQLIVSPKLSEDDIKAIKEGYKKKEEIIEKNLLISLNEELDDTEKDRLNLMIDLIAKGILEIKIAILDTDDDFGMYHEKIGVIIDNENNKLAFTGSYNESLNSYVNNFESLDVYSTLKGEYERVNEKNISFDKMWNNVTNKLQVVDVPEAITKELFEVYYDKEKVKSEEDIIVEESIKPKRVKPSLTFDKLRNYQKEAIEKWEETDYNGIFDMATGTGKTYTAIGAATRLYNNLNGNLAVIIVCPYTHLVEQWAEDLIQYGFNPIIGYGESNDRNWKEKLESKAMLFKMDSPNDKFFCLITTNASYKRPYIQSQIAKIEHKNVLFIADEAHNLGASDMLSKLNMNIKYRLALSATFERHNDEEGTSAILDYFNNNYCIHYDLKKAIEMGMLTEFNYHPILTSLNEEELYDYGKLTSELTKYLRKDKNGRLKLSDQAKFILLKRAKLVAGSSEKLGIIVNLLKSQYKKENGIYNTLIYCGATTINDPGYDEFVADIDDEKQINLVKKIVKDDFAKDGIELNVARFTSLEDNKMRSLIKEQFSNKEINIVTAIKCLDEGVNIPAIKTAYILASSTNPREYVQRRGRVLRKFDGKDYAEIYDFITLPRPLSEASTMSSEALMSDIGLIKREMTRIKDFADTASNYTEIYDIIEKINSIYGELMTEKNWEEEIDYE